MVVASIPSLKEYVDGGEEMESVFVKETSRQELWCGIGVSWQPSVTIKNKNKNPRQSTWKKDLLFLVPEIAIHGCFASLVLGLWQHSLS